MTPADQPQERGVAPCVHTTCTGPTCTVIQERGGSGVDPAPVIQAQAETHRVLTAQIESLQQRLAAAERERAQERFNVQQLIEHAGTYAADLDRLRQENQALRERVEAAMRLRRGKYLPWTNAGGPNECPHGRAESIPCPHCDERTFAALDAASTGQATEEHGDGHS